MCLFLKNVSPSKRVVCFILNNLHIPMVEYIHTYIIGHYNPSVRIIDLVSDTTYVVCVNSIYIFYIYSTNGGMPCINRVLIIPCKADGFSLFIGLPDEIKKSRLVFLSNLEFSFFIVLWSNLKQTLHY